MKQIKKIAITNEKGGVGKTMTAVNLSACLAQRGYRVLLIDADPQGYATLNYDVDVSPSLLEVLRGQVACTKAVQTTRFGVDVLPSDRTLSVIEEDLIRQKMNGAPYLNTLEKALEDLPDYDFVIIDCPPQGGRLMDIVEYQIISTLPTITSAATNISAYTFQDVLARGLSYVGGTNSVTLEFFTDANCTNKVTTWKQSDGKFKVTREENNDGTHTMTISMTDDGLAEINTANTAYDNDNGKLYAGYSNYTLRIRYDAKLNSDESLVYGDNGNKNEVVLTWKRTNGTYYDTLIDDAHIYTYATNITKTFSDGKEEQTMFDNVLFKAQNASDGYYVIAQLNEDEGIWYVTGHTDKEASATAMHPVEWNGKKGQIILKGVEDDQYIWTELETANGYTLLKNNIDVTIKSVDDANRPCDIYGKDTLGVIQNDPRYNFPNNEDYKLANIPQKQLAHNYQTASATVDGNDVTMLDDEMDTDSTNAIAPLTVVNTRVFITPMTGDRGTQALAIGGVLVFCLGTSAFIFFLVFKRRKEQEDK